MISSSLLRTVAVSFLVVVAGCTSTMSSFEVHTDELTCEEANRYVYDSMTDMRMKVTAFRPAKPGAPGVIRGHRASDGTRGQVTIACDADGVHVDPKQFGVSLDLYFERGIFLSLTGRSGLIVNRGVIEGRNRARSAEAGDELGVAAASARGASVAAATAGAAHGGGAPSRVAGRSAATPPAAKLSGGIRIRLEPLEGFSTVLDFDADVSAAGVLPFKVTVANGSSRVYDFDPADIVVRIRGSRKSAEALTAEAAVARLMAASARGTEIGDVAAASVIIRNNHMGRSRVKPGEVRSGYAYYPTGDYDRAKVTMIDVATGEIDGFLVEF